MDTILDISSISSTSMDITELLRMVSFARILRRKFWPETVCPTGTMNNSDGVIDCLIIAVSDPLCWVGWILFLA